MKTSSLAGLSLLRSILSLALLALGSALATAQTCTYMAMQPSGNMSPNFWIFPPGSYHEVSFGAGQGGCYYESSVVAGMGFAIQMTCDSADGNPAVYELDVTFRESSAYSHDILHALSVSSGSHLSQGTTMAYQSAANDWRTACYFTNDPGVVHPTVTFTYQSGTVSSTSRVYADMFRFIKLAWAPPQPTLCIGCCGTNLALSWPTSATGFGLYQSSDMGLRNWAPVTNTPSVTNGQNQVLIAPTPGACRFFRLQY